MSNVKLKFQISKRNLTGVKKRALIMLKEQKKLFPKIRMFLNYSNNWELLVAVILSAQCTDRMVNIVTKKLFKKYTKFEDYIKADIHEFESDIHSTGFYHNKAKNILATAKILKKKFHGKVPNSMEELLTLHGVARKTANVVLGNAFGIVEGIAVDTHVRRLSKLYGLTENDDPNKIEQDLMKVLPKNEWFDFTYRMIKYGRKYCPAKKHDHVNCPLVKALAKSQ